MIADFFAENIVLVYFLYGLAFFSMGLAVWLESHRSSELRLARTMVFLAGFGFLHGLHEWLEMFQQMGRFDNLNGEQWFFLKGIDLAGLVLSFLLLIIFGIRLIYANNEGKRDERSFSLMAAGGLASFWFFSVLLTRWYYNPGIEAFVQAVDVLARYIVGVPGAILAAWAIWLEQRSFRARGMPDFGRSLLGAAVALLLYGAVGQVFVSPSFLFPSNVINGDLFLAWFGVPVQLFRAATALFMALFVIQALRAFELESRQRLAAANEARLTAQAEALAVQRQSRQETEKLNQELHRAVQDLSMLFDLSRNLSATLNKETLLQETVFQIFGSLPRVGGGIIFLREERDKPLEIVTMSGYETFGNGIFTPEDCTFQQAHRLGEFVANTGLPAWCDGNNVIALDEAMSLESGVMMDTVIVDASGHTIGMPLVVQEEILGSVVLSVSHDATPFTRRDLSLISTVATQLSIALNNALLYEAVQEREELRGKLLHQVVSAQEKERQRVARELHDGTGQVLTALGLGLAATSESIHSNPEIAARHLAELRLLSDQALQEVHHIISDLRPSVLDNLGLVPAIQGQIQTFEQRTDIPVDFILKGERRRLQSDMETVIFRIVQEALTNVAKHSQADHVTVSFCQEPEEVTLLVQDDGRGFNPDATLEQNRKGRQSWGLLGMQERVELVGGAYEINSTPGLGTTVRIRLPLKHEEGSYVEDQVNVG